MRFRERARACRDLANERDERNGGAAARSAKDLEDEADEIDSGTS